MSLQHKMETKEDKRIYTLSKEAPAKATKKAAKAEEPQVEMPKVEKTTLGDLSALAELKASMEAEEKPAKKAPAKKAATKKAEKKEDAE